MLIVKEVFPNLILVMGTYSTLIFNLVFYYLLFNIVFNIIRIGLVTGYYRKNNFPPGHYDDSVAIINRMSFLVNHIMYIFVSLHLFGLNILTLLTSISIFAAALALIFRDFISNFLNGFAVLFSKNLDIGDYVKIGSYEGRIVDMSFVYIKLLTPNGEEVFIPNSLVTTKEFVNLSRVKKKSFQLDFSLPFRFFNKTNELEQIIKDKMNSQYGEKIKDKPIVMKIRNIDHQQIFLSFEFYTGSYNYELEQQIRKSCSDEILRFIELNENNGHKSTKSRKTSKKSKK